VLAAVDQADYPAKLVEGYASLIGFNAVQFRLSRGRLNTTLRRFGRNLQCYSL